MKEAKDANENGEILTKKEYEVIEALSEAKLAIISLEREVMLLKSRAFDMLLAYDLRITPPRPNRFLTADKCAKIAEQMLRKNRAEPQQPNV